MEAVQNKSDREKVEQALHDALKVQFGTRFDAEKKEVEQLEAEVKRLREQLELRRAKQDEIIEFRLQQLLRDAQGLGWGTEHASRTSANPFATGTYGIRFTETPGSLPPAGSSSSASSADSDLTPVPLNMRTR